MSTAAHNAEAINRRLEQLMPVLTPLGIALGFFLPGVFIHLRPFVPWLFGLMTLAGAMNLRASEFGSTIRSPVPILAFFISTHIIMPLCAMFAASGFFGGSPDTVAGFILLFSGPAAVSSFIWVTMFHGDKTLCLTLILLDTMLAPLVVPGTVSLLMGAKVAMDMTGIAVSLVLMVVIPTIIGVTLNETSRGKIPAIVCPYLNPVSKVCLMLVIAANTSPVAKIIRFDDIEVWKIMGLCITLSAGGFLLSKFAAAAIKCNATKSIDLFFTGGLRNISAVTTIAVTFFPEAAALPALLGIMFQQTLSAIMGKLCVNVDKKYQNHYDSP
ncbi:MAG: bile acid:sodium symporter family protein [Treponema sp.]|jgi:predicted Na+-dependent transporter|nr:bile acid:sodium symporter family protein [Treponema sp.]